MEKFILAKKIGMTQVFNQEGQITPVTLIEAGPCFVAQIKTKEKDGYNAVQFGFETPKKSSKNKGKKNFKFLRETRVSASDLREGDKVDLSIFKEGDKVKIAGLSKGKGFAGVVKRHGFHGGPASHGQKDRLRAPGSIGTSFPERVTKGRRMAGRMGSDRVSIKNLKIVSLDLENNLLIVKGAVPGRNGGLLEIIGKGKNNS